MNPLDPKTQAIVQALLQPQGQQPQPVPFETPESVMAKMFQGVDPMSPQADAIRERAMQQYMNNSPFAPRGR